MFSALAEKSIFPEFNRENRFETESFLEGFLHQHLGYLFRKISAAPPFSRKIVTAVKAHEHAYIQADNIKLDDEILQLRRHILRHGISFASASKAFALIREQAARKLGTRHFDTQILGGWVMLKGMIAEMETGEGKTLTATLPACTVALAGIPVHIITVNEYLAKRDANLMRPVYHAMGLTVGVVTHGMSEQERRKVYQSNVVYATNKDIVFDYLKDHLQMKHRPGHINVALQRLYVGKEFAPAPAQRGLYFAIIDEADSVLIDEALTPLIISGRGDNTYEKQIYKQGLDYAKQLSKGVHFTLDSNARQLSLTESGRSLLEERTNQAGGLWHARRHREELVLQALTALFLFEKNQEYVVQNGLIQIIDKYTGRKMEDRSWERGLHQMIECKEGCEVTPSKETLARMSFQRFFRRYQMLAGMTGTGRETAKELWSTYKLFVVRVPTNRARVRIEYPYRFFLTEDLKLRHLVQRTKDLQKTGRPVLIGTTTVAVSEKVSRLLRSQDLPHRVLNARQDQDEANIIAKAGHRGQITVATSMAGRGTDIQLGEGVKEIGGLHVIISENHSAARIDRQLSGRCGRQGDPGSFEIMASLHDTLVQTQASTLHQWFLTFLASRKSRIAQVFLPLLIRHIQFRLEKKHHRMRNLLLKHDQSLDKSLAFSGQGE